LRRSARRKPARALKRGQFHRETKTLDDLRLRDGAGVVSRLEQAPDHNQLEAELRRLERYRLLIIDKVGWRTFDAL